ncbi:MAG: YicC family protein [Rikenellaceae bacterium]|nr:YicC family protein [Rikenellaceae bacterium]
MTGFGKAEATTLTKKITVEVRSLNSKQLDLSVKLPGVYRHLEFEIRQRATAAITRGKADVSVSIEHTAPQGTTTINSELFKLYLGELKQTLCDASFEVDNAAILPVVMRMPDVISTQQEQIPNEEEKALLGAVDEALACFNAFREQEGKILIEDLLRRVDNIEQYKLQVEPYEATRVETIKNRIRENIAQMHIDVDSNRLEQEMIFYIEKLDITEEKVRLANHCNYFREVAATEDAAGRKLGFIAQEMGREINTLGSKSNEANMQILVVKMKDELEKIKEQVLNIL